MDTYKIEPVGNRFNVNKNGGLAIATVDDEKLANAIVCLLETPRLIANISGGCLQGLMLDERVASFLDAYVVDYDTEGSYANGDNVFDLETDHGRYTVAVGGYGLDQYDEDSDDAQSVLAYLDPSKRASRISWRRPVTYAVLFDDASWEKHTVLVEIDEPSVFEESWIKSGTPLVDESIRCSNKVAGRKVVKVIAVECGDVERVERKPETSYEQQESEIAKNKDAAGSGS